MDSWAKYEKLQHDVDSLRYLLAMEFSQNLELLGFYEKDVKKLRSCMQQGDSKATAKSVNANPSLEIVSSIDVSVLELVLGASTTAAWTLREEIRSALKEDGDEDPCGFVRMVEIIKKLTGADDFDGMAATNAVYTMIKTLIGAQKDKEAAALLAEGKGYRPDRLTADGLTIDWYLHVNPGTRVMNLRFLMKQLLKVVRTQIKRHEKTRASNWIVRTFFIGICNCQKQEQQQKQGQGLKKKDARMNATATKGDWRRLAEIGISGKWEAEDAEMEHQDTYPEP